MQKLLILQGIVAAGKSTFAKQFVLDNPTYVRVNRDSLRNMAGKYWEPKREDLITKWELKCVANALDDGYNVVLDATNLNPTYLKKWKNLDHTSGKKLKNEFEIEYKFFDINLDEAISRDMGRPKEEQVGAKVITSMYNKYIVAKKIEEIQEGKIKQDSTLPKAVLLDIDGTVAISHNRDIFDYSKVMNDLPNEAVVNIVKGIIALGQHRIIYMSGREDYCKEDTVNWLANNGLLTTGYSIYMRKSGDHRKDTIVKKELFDENIKGRYFIDFCLDDRNCVCDQYREMGLKVIQVCSREEGNF